MSARSFSGREAIRSAAELGFDSLAVTCTAAIFIGGILVVQSGFFVKLVGARPVLGWAAGYGILREFGPLLVALVFSGRVGARNAAEIAALRGGEQLDALRALSLDPWWLVIAPRAAAMVACAAALAVIGDVAALLSGSVFAKLLLDVEPSAFFRSFTSLLTTSDFGSGVVKAVAFGAVIAAVSTWSGLRGTGGARGVGEAAARSVVLSAFALLAVDYLLTGALA